MYGEAAVLYKYYETPRAETEAVPVWNNPGKSLPCVLFTSSNALGKVGQNLVCKRQHSLSQRPAGCCLLLLVLGELQWVLNYSVLFQQHLQGQQPCKVLTGAALEDNSISGGDVRGLQDECPHTA